MKQITVEYVNDSWEGIAHDIDGKKIIIQHAVAGDEALITIQENKNFVIGHINEIIKPGEARKKPDCKHFDECGGCSLQYFKDENYLSHKTSILKELIEKSGFNKYKVSESFSVDRYTRRRASFAVDQKNNIIGYYKEHTHQVFDLQECLIITKEIFDSLSPLKDLIKNLNIKISRIDISMSDNGLYLIFHSEDKLELSDSEILKSFAGSNNFIRLSIFHNDKFMPIYIKESPKLILDDIRINIPEGAFLQATKMSQDFMINLIIKYFSKFKKIADLYGGLGTYSFPLSKFSKIDIFEGSEIMVKSIENVKPNVTARIRNLHSHPLTAKELNLYDGVIINPPRNGCERQIRQIQNSSVKNVIIISCNHNSFKRDIVLLKISNFELVDVKLIDQFLYTKHFEIFAYFKRK